MADTVKRTSDVAEPEHWLMLQTGPGPAAFNMALDEALLEHAVRLGRPVLRFYGWNEPAATFGYFQKFAEVSALTALRPLVRRPTGGGLVPHDSDWTYSVVIPPTHSWHALTAHESYRQLHAWLEAAFRTLGVEPALAQGSRVSAPGQCFAGWEDSDLLLDGRKLAGAAQRRNRSGLLLQGSVQPPLRAAKADWQRALCDTARESWNAQWSAMEPDPALRERAAELAGLKYSRDEFNRRR